MFERLERYAGKLARTVLRGRDGGNTVLLPGGGNGNVVSSLDTMRVTILGQYLKGLSRLNQEVGEGIQKTLESVKWLLWHGKVDKALDRLRDLDQRINYFTDSYPRFPQLKTAVQKFRIYLENNRCFLPNYGRRYRRGERISTAFVESTVNSVISKRFVKKQSMQWTKRGAHLLLQTRVKTLNNELAATFRRWYPDFKVEDAALAAGSPAF
jgi:hypothetical protein